MEGLEERESRNSGGRRSKDRKEDEEKKREEEEEKERKTMKPREEREKVTDFSPIGHPRCHWCVASGWSRRRRRILIRYFHFSLIDYLFPILRTHSFVLYSVIVP